MFAVKMESLHQAHSEFMMMYSCIYSALEEVDATRRRLMDNTDMEVPFKELTRLRVRLEEQVLVIGQMARALERIRGIYMNTESLVADNCDNPRLTLTRYEWSNNDLTSVRQTLGDIKIM